MQFQDELAAGTILVRPALQSPDYVTGVSGWAIKIDGSAEFNNILIRGTGTDPAIIVGPDGEPQVIIYNNGANGVVEFPTNDPNESSPGRMASVVYDQGDPDERLSLEIQGPAHDVNDDRLAMQFNSARADLSTPASVSIFDVETQNLIFFADTNRVQVNEALQVTPEDDDTNIPLFVDGKPPSGTSIAVIRRDGSNVLNIPNEGNLQVSPTIASALSALFVNAPSGHTGRLVRAQLNGADRFTVEPTGDANFVGSVTAANFRHGTAQTAAPGAGGGTTVVSVVFATAMPNTPRVTIDPVTTVDPGTVTIRGYVDNVSTAGFDIRAYRSTNSATNWSYNATCD
jgi:hypothetical protein